MGGGFKVIATDKNIFSVAIKGTIAQFISFLGNDLKKQK